MKVNSLSFLEQQKYKVAIQHGYFADYDKDQRAWKHSFVGAFIWKNPIRVKTIDIFTEVLGHIPTWEDLTDMNLEDFAEAMTTHYAANSVKNRFAEVKAVINRHIFSVEIPSKRFSQILTARSEPSQAIYLNEEEIERINRYVPATKEEEYVKKIFLIEAYTGARNCDAERLTPENCDMDTNLLTYISQKTKTQITLPVHRNLMRYLANPIDMEMCSFTFNKVLRQICQNCKIAERMTVFRRGKEMTAEKWEFVSSHAGRRSFATNLFLRKADPSLIAKYMGHSSPDITMKRYIIGYIQASTEVMKFFN